MYKTKYRVVTDNYAGYEVQYKLWWWPFWIQASDSEGRIVNTFFTLEEATKYAKELKCKTKCKAVWYV